MRDRKYRIVFSSASGWTPERDRVRSIFPPESPKAAAKARAINISRGRKRRLRWLGRSQVDHRLVDRSELSRQNRHGSHQRSERRGESPRSFRSSHGRPARLRFTPKEPLECGILRWVRLGDTSGQSDGRTGEAKKIALSGL